ncbi:hypothetical protein ACI65C_010721 [Semiaphis heraclei]
MNINYVQGIVLIVIACVLHTNCKKAEKPLNKSDKFLEKNPSKSSHKRDGKLLNDKKKNEVENMLLTIASIIQDCVDKKTMNDKNFKKRLDDLYNDLVRPKITNAINKQLIEVEEIKKKFEEDVEVLKKMDSTPVSNNSKKSGKKQKTS